jgi:multicomponent Na+:H+ antiporter subunit B
VNSLVLKTATRFLTVLLAVFSVFILLRGHNEPGGGFIGGLLIASAFMLHNLAFGVREVRALLRIDPRTLMGIGLAVALVSGCLGLLAGRPLLTALWLGQPVPGLGKIGTVLMFDVGVFLVVLGAVLTILLGLAEETEP